jgi:hypothetical protein
MAEKEDLFGQLVPVWTAQDGEKLEMVNSILDKTPEADKEEVQKFLEGKDLAELKIINSLNATGETPRGIQNGGIGSGRKPEDDEELTQEEYMKGLGLA